MSADKPKNIHAVALGRLGGKAKGKPKGFAAATPEQRRAWGRMGGKAKKQSSGTTSAEKPPPHSDR
jgi:hypothetical protein